MRGRPWAAVEDNTLNGDGDGRLTPEGPVIPAQTAQMLKNFMENR